MAVSGTEVATDAVNGNGVFSIYQSMSGDADVGEASFSAKSGSITVKSGGMFYVTNTDCKIYLENVALRPANDTLLRVEGKIIVDKIFSLDMTLSRQSVFHGSVNTDGTAGGVKVVLEDQAVWNLASDSYISQFEGEIFQIKANGYPLYVDGKKLL